jgi:hypothetical protein
LSVANLDSFNSEPGTAAMSGGPMALMHPSRERRRTTAIRAGTAGPGSNEDFN